MKLGIEIKKLRKEKGLSLRGLARLVGVSPAFICRVENGKKWATPSEKVIKKISLFLGVSQDHLMHLAGRIPQDIQDIILSDVKYVTFLREVKKNKIKGKDLLHRIDYLIASKKLVERE